MIQIIIIFIFLVFFTVKEYFYYNMNSSYTSTLVGMVQTAALSTRLSSAVEGYREKLMIIYCSGCKSVQSKITTDFFNTLGNNLSNIQISRIDLSKSDDPLNLIRGFIHPKYLIKDSYYSNNSTPVPTTSSPSYEYNIDQKLASYFHSHNDPNYGRENPSYQCEGPDLFTQISSAGTTLESVSDNLEYEEHDEYLNNECDYFLAYKTPTIIYEIKDHAYLKFPEEFPISNYPCTPQEQEQYQNEIILYIDKLRHWIYYLKEFSNKLIGLYDLIRINMSSSCTQSAIELVTDTVNSKDAHYNVIGKYYHVLCNAYPKTQDHVNRLNAYENQGKKFYREKDSGNSLLNSNDAEDLDYLRVDRTRIPTLNGKLTLTDPDNITIRGNRQRLVDYAKRTLMIMFRGYLEQSNFNIPFIDNYSTNPETFMRHINDLVRDAVCSTNNARLQTLKDIFANNGFPTPEQTWRSYVDPKTGMANENYGWFLLTFEQPLGITESSWYVDIDNDTIIGDPSDNIFDNNLPLRFQPYPYEYFENSAFRSSSDQPQVRRFQNIIQPCLLEFGFIKSNREDRRLYGCENYLNNVTIGVESDCTLSNCQSYYLVANQSCST